jgi:hypothetical protein
MIESMLTISLGAIVLFAVAVLFVAAVVSFGPALLIFAGQLWIKLFVSAGTLLIVMVGLSIVFGLEYIKYVA